MVQGMASNMQSLRTSGVSTVATDASYWEDIDWKLSIRPFYCVFLIIFSVI